ncbi:RNA polymerase sigma-70 factor, ECF subfamily [Pseudovibrio ascidiaceicola]|uniref:RNA polymerase sigma factor n=1 Tax=Pseudovibrio ascidiaceicola TaxID=285279 RepID=A0A1I3Y204_9HYPH|nr:sigma-70 family RNA polymerase sigma factor [Pseudovibrio ascidiaceicola]SFK25780.1 RNA polymerase sigma-70 factor, ECF subfamily [Pseudovibrio ascidiaceicola]
MQLQNNDGESENILTSADLSALLQSLGRERSREIFRQLFEFFAPRLKTYFLKGGATSELSEELVQETFVIVWRKAEMFDSRKASASTWIYTIARNLRIDRFRKERRYLYKDDQFFANELVGEETQLDDHYQSQLSERVKKALPLLPAEQSTIIKLAFYEDASHSKIAQYLELPLGTVKSRMRLALARLRKLLEGVDL